MKRSVSFVGLILVIILFAGCQRVTFTSNIMVECADGFSDIEITLSGESDQAPLVQEANENGVAIFKLNEAEFYNVTAVGWDETKRFITLIYKGQHLLNEDEDMVVLPNVGELTWSFDGFIDEAGLPSYFVDDLLPSCNHMDSELRIYRSDDDPANWADPNSIYTEDYLVSSEPFVRGRHVTVDLTDSNQYVALEVSSITGTTSRSIPYSVNPPDSIIHPLELNRELTIVVLRGQSKWFRLPAGPQGMHTLEWFDMNSKELSGEGLLISAFADSGRISIFEKAALRKPDGAARIVYNPYGGEVWLKLEVSPDGTSGSFNIFAHAFYPNNLSPLSDTLFLNAFGGLTQSRAQSLSPGSYVLRTYETNPENRTVRYSLINLKEQKMLVDHEDPGSDSNYPKVHSFTINSLSEVLMVVSKSYWGDFENEVIFELE